VQDHNVVRMAIEKQAAAFSAAFNRGDVKAVAAMYTEALSGAQYSVLGPSVVLLW
jgi:ketosteroid isomerase-like protein